MKTVWNFSKNSSDFVARPFPNFDLVQVSHVEERKNDQIEHIKKSHEKAFNEIKNYYNDITLNNLAMIATLKEEIKERDVKIERSEKQVLHLCH